MGIDNSCHVVFLIDTHEQTLALWKIKHIILQILLYFFASVDKDTTWGFRFFNSQSAVVDVIKHPFYPITDESIELFVAHYSQQINKESKRHTLNSTSARRNTPYAVLKETLMQLLAEFQWSNTDSYSSYVSTRRTPKSGCFVSGKSCQGVTIINHVYLLTDCPETHEKMLHFVGHSLPPSITTTTEEMQQTKTLAKAVQFMAYDMQKSLWENYVKRQISLNWINTSPTAATLEETKGVQRKIALGLSRFLDLFGGHLFPHYLALIHHAKYGYSFTSIFDAYYSSQMETIVKHTGAPTTHQSHSLSTYYALMNSPGTDPKDTFWQGLFKINSENGIFSLNITHTSYKVELVPFFSATRQIPKEDCSIPSHTIDLFQKVTCLNTMVTVPTADIDPH
ncbi:hypothetical protein BDF14DRAFT_376648 [Spinellus fusiger]|nr:hypothetical protein BDF14DRAFT_376648 [Spinellus fusiger]